MGGTREDEEQQGRGVGEEEEGGREAALIEV